MPKPDQGRRTEDTKRADAKRKEAEAKGSKGGDKKDKKDDGRSERRSQH